MESRNAIAPHKTATSDSTWDGPQAKSNLKLDQDENYYKKAYAWMDPEGDPKTKAAYKFIHHEVSDAGDIGAANIKGCQSGIGVLNGGMGGTTIPDADHQGVYNHLAKHIKDAGQEPPELKSATSDGIEHRLFNLTEIIVQKKDNEPAHIIGHAAVFNTIANIGWFREQILPGAFKKTLKTSDVRALFNHDPNYVLGRNVSNTLSLSEDEKGLAIDLTPPDTQLVRDMVLTPMERGDLNQMSFGFQVSEEQWNEVKDEDPLRSIVIVDPLFDVSVVTFPAYPTTDAKLRNVLRQVGIDYDKLSSILFRLKRGLACEKSDFDLINNTIEVLRGYIPAPPDGTNGGKGEGNGAGRLTVLRKRLELIQKTF